MYIYLTLGAVGAYNAHGADPVRTDLGHQRVEHLQAGGVHHEDLWVMTVTQQPALPLHPEGELVELHTNTHHINNMCTVWTVITKMNQIKNLYFYFVF